MWSESTFYAEAHLEQFNEMSLSKQGYLIYMQDFAEHLDCLLAYYKANGEAININFRELFEIRNYDRLTHYIHSYPAKLLQCIPIYFIKNSLMLPSCGLVYDPFCGSGTVAVEALFHGNNSYNRDVNPFASLLTKVKCTHIENEKILNELETLNKRSRKIRKKNHLVLNQDFWYEESVYCELSKIIQAINEINDENIANFFKVIFSTTARKMSYADPRISVPVKLKPEKYPMGHKLRIAAEKAIQEISPGNVLKTFNKLALANLKRLSSIDGRFTGKLEIELVNAQTPPSADQSKQVDLIITSPPYPGAQKYIRASSMSLSWLGLHTGCLTPLKKQVIGREEVTLREYTGHSGSLAADEQIYLIAQKDKERAAIAESYLREMHYVFKSCYLFLKKDAYFVVVTANNLFRGIEFYTQKHLCELAAQEGLELSLELVDDIKSYGLMTKRNKTASVISREVVSVFRKR